MSALTSARQHTPCSPVDILHQLTWKEAFEHKKRTQQPGVVLDGDAAVVGAANGRQVVGERRLLQQRASCGVRVGRLRQRVLLAACLQSNIKGTRCG